MAYVGIFRSYDLHKSINNPVLNQSLSSTKMQLKLTLITKAQKFYQKKLLFGNDFKLRLNLLLHDAFKSIR